MTVPNVGVLQRSLLIGCGLFRWRSHSTTNLLIGRSDDLDVGCKILWGCIKVACRRLCCDFVLFFVL